VFNFSWVIPGKLAASGMLGSRYGSFFNGSPTLAEDLEFAARQKIGALVSLTETALDEGEIRVSGLDYLHLPVEDMRAPAVEDCRRFVDFAADRIDRGIAVLVHCVAGRGRTGTMLACFFVRQGCGPLESLERVRRLRPGSVETEAQEAVVLEYAARHKVRG
jgi:atypical dual specificity phosphatase